MASKVACKPARDCRADPPLTYAQWKAAAVEIMGGRAGTMAERHWNRAYITGVTPEDVAKLAETYRTNTVAADKRKRR